MSPLLLLLTLFSILRGTLAECEAGCELSVPTWISVLKFAPNDNALIIADSRSATLFAYPIPAPEADLTETPLDREASYNIPDLEVELKKALDLVPECVISISDLAIDPVSKDAYVGVNKVLCDDRAPAIVIFSHVSETRVLDFSTPHTSFKVSDPPDSTTAVLGKFLLREMTFTDLQVFGDKLYLSGLSNGEHSSTLRVIDYPFTDESKMLVTHLKIYHPSHDQNETRAPIRALRMGAMEGKNYAFGIFTGTPLVLIPVDNLEDGKEVFGQTIAQLGYGNTPLDMVIFLMRTPGSKSKEEIVMITNSHQSAIILQVHEIVAASKKPGMLKPPEFQFDGVPNQRVPINNVLHLDDQDGKRLAAVRRDLFSGRLELISFIKGPYMRHGDFAKEHDFPGYTYPETLAPAKMGHTMLKIEEGLVPKSKLKEEEEKTKQEL